ncbi:DSBA oxidoreductase [Paramyrothecium foliicola]|nr:DSBA oxidoreductase [Paramyrothecium foliicola]
MTHFRISIVSDNICPWCFVGYRRFLAAQALWAQKHPSDTFSVRFHPYQLHPELPRGISRDKQTVYAEKFGAERVAQMFPRLAQIGETVGIHFKFGGRIGSTRDSHRVVHLAGRLGGEQLERKTIEGLFSAYFENERDITDLDTLKSIATDAGIPEAEFKKSIVDSDEGGAEVDRAVAEARFNGVTGVPDFTIQDHFNFSGAQEPATFVEIFEKVKALEG